MSMLKTSGSADAIHASRRRVTFVVAIAASALQAFVFSRASVSAQANAGSFGPANPSEACAALASLDLGPGKKIAIEFLRAGQSTSDAADKPLPPFCRIRVRSALSTDSSIEHELWLPAAAWNGRFLGTGNGAWAGRIDSTALAEGLGKGFAVANTDMGTSPVADGAFAVGHPIRWLDYGQRATHDMTVVAKALIHAFYGHPARYSYFEGCSTGGFQGQREAELFPSDYDGIVAGHPGDRRSAKVISLLYNYMQPKLHPEGIIPNAKLMMMYKAVLATCAGQGGGRPDDPFVTVPTACNGKPESLLCRAAENDTCLTQAQVDMANRFYSPWVLKSTGQEVYPGLPRGTELGWSEYMDAAKDHDPPHAAVVRSILGANHDFWTSDWDRDVAAYMAVQGALWADAAPTGLASFRNRGAKMLIHFGLNDTSSFYDVAQYYEGIQREIARSERLTDAAAGRQLRESIRLFTLPGVEHCGGGNGPNTMDTLSALMLWVEKGVTPRRIDATWVARPGRFPASLGRPMTRPSCPYPEVARYNGQGDPDRAESFHCGLPELTTGTARVSLPTNPVWLQRSPP